MNKYDDEITRAMVACGVGHLPAEYLKVCEEAVRLAQESRQETSTFAARGGVPTPKRRARRSAR